MLPLDYISSSSSLYYYYLLYLETGPVLPHAGFKLWDSSILLLQLPEELGLQAQAATPIGNPF
jgi:hypothetical protein